MSCFGDSDETDLDNADLHTVFGGALRLLVERPEYPPLQCGVEAFGNGRAAHRTAPVARRNGNGRIRIQSAGRPGLRLASAGRFDLTGQAAGNLHQLRTSGSAELSALRIDRYSVGYARLTYDVGVAEGIRTAGPIRLKV